MSETQKGYEIDPEGPGLSCYFTYYQGFYQKHLCYQVFLFEIIPRAPITCGKLTFTLEFVSAFISNSISFDLHKKPSHPSPIRSFEGGLPS